MSSNPPPGGKWDIVGKVFGWITKFLDKVDPRWGAACTFCGFLGFLYETIFDEFGYFPWAVGFLGVSIAQWGVYVKDQKARAELAAQIKRNTDITVTAAAEAVVARKVAAIETGGLPPPPSADPAIAREVAKQEIRASNSGRG